MSQPENFGQIFACFFGLVGTAAQVGIQLPRAFYVYGKQVNQTGIKKRFHDEGAHAVCIKLDTHVQVAQVSQYGFQLGHQRCFTAGNNHTVNPFHTVFKKTHDAVFADWSYLVGAPCHGEVVAGGAMHIAAAHKYDAGIVAGPVAQADPFKSTHIRPCRIHNKLASFCNPAQRCTGCSSIEKPFFVSKAGALRCDGLNLDKV